MLDQSEIQILRQLVYTQSAQLQAIATIADIDWDGVDWSRSLFIVISYYALSDGTVHNQNMLHHLVCVCVCVSVEVGVSHVCGHIIGSLSCCTWLCAVEVALAIPTI